jgi:hypothetical protein
MATKKPATKTATTQVAIPRTQKDVPATIEMLKKQLDFLKGNVDENISLDVTYNTTKIKDVKTLAELLEIESALEARSKSYDEAVVRHNLTGRAANFTHNKIGIEKWRLIMAKAIHELINNQEIKQLEEAISELSKHLDAETRLQQTLSKIMKSAQAPIV